MNHFELKFNIYAESPQEVEELQKEIIDFINIHAREGRVVTAKKVALAIKNWQSISFVKNKIIKYFQ